MSNIAQQILSMGTGIVGNAINTGLGIMFGRSQEKHNDARQLEQQRKLQQLEIAGQQQMTDYNFNKQLEMWKATNYSAQMEQMRKANVNPALIYGTSGAGGTTQIAQGNVSGADAPKGGHESYDQQAMGVQFANQAMQLQLLEAQKKNIEADTANKQAQTTKTSGPDTENIITDTQSKILQNIITKYTGLRAEQVWEKFQKPNVHVEAKTIYDELAARQALAGTIYELWVEGKLYDKSINEVEQIALNNAKTKAETENIYKQKELLEQNIKGAKLDNIMKDLEMKLQTETGIDKNSPAWMKILGRLFVTLFGKD